MNKQNLEAEYRKLLIDVLWVGVSLNRSAVVIYPKLKLTMKFGLGLLSYHTIK